MLTRLIWIAAIVAATISVPAFGQSVVGSNTNAVGPFPDGFYRGIPHYQDNEPHCDRNPLLPANIVCMVNGYNGADDLIGDGWPKILETQDNARTWNSRFATGSLADPASSLGLGFGADPIMACFPGGCAGFFIASNRSLDGGGEGGGVYMQLMPEYNVETGFRHFSEQGPRTVQLGTGDNFLDKIDAIFVIDEQNPGTVEVTMDVEKGGGVIVQNVVRTCPKGRFIVVYASFNSSSQNVRIFSTYSDDFGATWSPPKQVAQTSGIDTGVAVSAINDTVVYAYRQFEDTSGGQTDAVFAAVSTSGGKQIGKIFPVVENLCPFDQPTLPETTEPNPLGLDVVASRTNNFVDLGNDGNNFVMVLSQRFEGPDGCLDQPFDYPAGSRVYVTWSGGNGKGWQPLVPLAPRDGSDGPRNGHSFQFMPAVDCARGTCQAIWYDTLRDSQRNLSFLDNSGRSDAATIFETYPLFADFYLGADGPDGFEVLQFRRTADVYTRRFEVAGNNVNFEDAEPVRVTRFQLARVSKSPDIIAEVEQLPFGLKQYRGGTAAFMGDYVGIASSKIRLKAGATGPDGEPVYESNQGIEVSNPLLRPNWFAYWTDTRGVRGQLYTQNLGDAPPFQKTPMGGAATTSIFGTNDGDALVAEAGDDSNRAGEKRMPTAEGLEDSNFGVGVCTPPASPPGAGDVLFIEDNQNRIKDADVFGALIGSPATAWVLNATKGLGDIQRTYTIAARNDDELSGKTFLFEIANQPVGFDTNEARASWLQLPFENFNHTDPTSQNPPFPYDIPEPTVSESVGPLSSVTVALFVTSAQAINPVTVNVYELVDEDNDPVTPDSQFLVETLTVNGALEAGDLVGAFAIDPNVLEIHDPLVFPPLDVDPTYDPLNPQVFNPQVFNPQVFNPQVFNPQVFNPQVFNPQVFNPQVFNPQVFNPQVFNTALTSADELDNEEIPDPDLSGLRDSNGNLVDTTAVNLEIARFDVLFGVSNEGNTLTPYTADFAVNSSLVRQRIQEGKVKLQLIVWEDARYDDYQACEFVPEAAQLRVIAAVNNPDFLNLKIPDIFNNRFGSVTFYLEPFDKLQITLRFLATKQVIQEIDSELFDPGLSWVVTSQAANTGETNLDPGVEQAISDKVPPTLSINADTIPVPLTAIRQGDEIGAVLPTDLVSATKGEFENPPVSCGESGAVVTDPANAVPLGSFLALPLGSSELTCLATAENDVTGTVNFGVDVTDTTPPTLGPVPASFLLDRELVNGTDLSATAQAAAAVFDSADDLPTATDDIDASVAVRCAYPPSTQDVTLAPGGIAPFDPAENPTATVVTCSATDSSGNSASDTFTITVRDNTPPVVAPVTDVSTAATAADGAMVTVSPPSATDAGNIVASDCTAFDPAISVVGTTRFPIAATPVTCNATDDVDNTGTTSFTVTVFDITAPVFDTTVADFTVEANATGGAENVTFTAPTASDLGQAVPVQCDADPTGSFFPIGTTTVTCTATDLQGNEAIDTFLVTVADTTPPVLTVPADITVLFGATVTFEATATDNADADPVVSCSPPSGTVFPLGTTTVNCTATDDEGLTDSGSFTVNVVLGGTSSLKSNKKSVNSGAVAGFTWVWEDYLGNSVDVGEGNQDVEARPGECPSSAEDILNEDPGSSDIRLQSDGLWTFNWQTVDDEGDPIAAGTYCFSVVLMTTDPHQVQSTEIRVR
jgi:hypothetical protein